MTGSEFQLSESAPDGLALLEVVHAERRSTLELIRSTLFELGLQIVRVESTVKGQTLTERFFVSQADGAPLTRERARGVRSAVRKALRYASRAAA